MVAPPWPAATDTGITGNMLFRNIFIDDRTRGCNQQFGKLSNSIFFSASLESCGF